MSAKGSTGRKDGSLQKQGDADMYSLRHWCAYRERCRQEAFEKMRQLGLTGTRAEAAMNLLVSEGYLDEDRYARLFATGKFRSRKWGRLRIRAALRAKGIPNHTTEAALAEIDTEEYLQALRQLIFRKTQEHAVLKGEALRLKVLNFARSKGYEPWLIKEVFEDCPGDS